jgi:hypothetical protein
MKKHQSTKKSGGGSKLAERAALLWKDWDPEETPNLLTTGGNNLPGADLLVLDSQSSVPDGPDLERRYLALFKTAQDLEFELIEVIEASEFEGRSKKAIIRVIKEFGTVREALGRVSGQFELLAADQYFNNKKADKSKRTNPLFVAEERRIRLMLEWMKEEETRGLKGTNIKRFRKWVADKKIEINLEFTEKTWRRSVAKARGKAASKSS